MSSSPEGTDLLISYDSLPKVGGAHSWLHETYSRWPTPVRLLTAAYSADVGESAAQRAFDARSHGSLSYVRAVHGPEQINLLSPGCWATFLGHSRIMSRLVGRSRVMLHALRAFPEGFAGMLYKRLHPSRTVLVTYAHGEEILIAQTSGQLKLMAQWTYAASDLVIANSQSTIRLLRALAPRVPVVCINPGVDAGAYRQPAADIAQYRSGLGWPEGTVILATLARMEPRKNHAQVIRAVAELRAQNVPVAYLCGGDGPQRAGLEALAGHLGVSKWVRFTGAVPESEKKLIFGACDIHVMASIQVGEMIEGFGIVFIEAAAAGKPSISGRIGGQAEAVLNDRTGLVIDGANPGELVAAIRRLAEDESVRRAMGEEGRRWAQQHDYNEIARATVEATAGARAKLLR